MKPQITINKPINKFTTNDAELLLNSLRDVYGFAGDNAKKIISKICNLSDKSEITFFVGGTITNSTLIDSLIPPYLM